MRWKIELPNFCCKNSTCGWLCVRGGLNDVRWLCSTFCKKSGPSWLCFLLIIIIIFWYCLLIFLMYKLQWIEDQTIVFIYTLVRAKKGKTENTGFNFKLFTPSNVFLHDTSLVNHSKKREEPLLYIQCKQLPTMNFLPSFFLL